MSETTEIFSTRRLIILCSAGILLWLLASYAPPFLVGSARPGQAELLLLLHVLVLSTANLFLMQSPDRSGRHSLPFRWAVSVHPGAGVAALASLWSARGWEAGLLSLPYLAFAGLLAAHSLRRFLGRGHGGPGPFLLSELSVDSAGAFLAVGAGWMTLDRFGAPVLDFSPMIVLLTALHFHYAGCTTSLVSGLLGRLFVARGVPMGALFAIVSAGVLFGPILTATGIAFSPLLEVAAAVLFGLAMIGLAICLAAVIGLAEVPAVSRVLLLAASLGLCLAMGLALLFAVGEYLGRVTITIPDMVRTHGVINGGLFGAGTTLAFLLIRPPECTAPGGLPFSRLSAGFSVGPDFFERRGLLSASDPAPWDSQEGAPPFVPEGLCDSLDEYATDDFDPGRVHPSVRRFYENTGEFELEVRARWSRLFAVPGRLYKRLSRRLGQMNFPVGLESPERQMDSRIFALSDAADGRRRVRAWVRAYRATGESIYAAAYSRHTHAGRSYMNIAFPLPGGNLTSILRLSHPAPHESSNSDRAPGRSDSHAGGIELSTLCREDGVPGDEGIYFAVAGFGIRIPMNEVIRIRPRLTGEQWESPAADRTELVAHHEMFLFGLSFLSLDYHIHRAAPAAGARE